MQKFTKALKSMMDENPALKSVVNELLTDHLMILRQTKYDPESAEFLTKYTNVNSVSGTQSVIDEIRPAIEERLDSLGGSFTKEWAVTVVQE
jgi:hypothetical protein